ncbi:hypothetical protein A3740_03225 [Oleiphilus sp. HI0068]|uniref:hypothetical protein n=1 Tax=Oleiphilus sp. HI0132 TaxID=1822270 RepID=UPI0007C303D2|nr:hypothetical protein [Oleiphilus sp. HI0132]KZY73753.1 hypothetical protein A3740_03225 [Oleiphilus sp. HI0068]KZY84155.1 hypothetical protein A3741_16290 [Oleiphilus sp. HI0069]KZZ47277.1 hypothetical protein A3755_02405 [Oleiphilus sp. HI0085]KZY84251.1 hypothetical protein A3741_30095 [Oleiphilus sp. HI0069]KZZ76739.1 hypothetical protein A3766_13190 [Oleiphilus sp. HI0132]
MQPDNHCMLSHSKNYLRWIESGREFFTSTNENKGAISKDESLDHVTYIWTEFLRKASGFTDLEKRLARIHFERVIERHGEVCHEHNAPSPDITREETAKNYLDYVKDFFSKL